VASLGHLIIQKLYFRTQLAVVSITTEVAYEWRLPKVGFIDWLGNARQILVCTQHTKRYENIE
jgi:hypothetical protein